MAAVGCGPSLSGPDPFHGRPPRPCPAPGWPHRLQLGSWQAGADPCEAVLHALATRPKAVIEAGAWPLQCSQLQAIAQRLEQAGLQLEGE